MRPFYFYLVSILAGRQGFGSLIYKQILLSVNLPLCRYNCIILLLKYRNNFIVLCSNIVRVPPYLQTNNGILLQISAILNGILMAQLTWPPCLGQSKFCLTTL